MAVEVPQNEEISEEGGMEMEKESILLSVGEEQIGGNKHYGKRARKSCLERC